MLTSVGKEYGPSCIGCAYVRQSKVAFYNGTPIWGAGEFVCVLHKKHLPFKLYEGLLDLEWGYSISCIDWTEGTSGAKYFVKQKGLFAGLLRLFGRRSVVEEASDRKNKNTLYKFRNIYEKDFIEKYMNIDSLKDATEKELAIAVPNINNKMAIESLQN